MVTISKLGVPDQELPCYKCGQPVRKENSVIHFEWHLEPLFGVPWWDYDCHLFPVEGEHPCIGSPSRFQYFPGYPRDERKEFAYHQESEAAYREALEKLRAETLDEMIVDLEGKLREGLARLDGQE